MANNGEQLVVKRGGLCVVVPADKTQKGIYPLSNLDCQYPCFIGTISCYRSKEKGNEKAGKLIKEGLSKILVHYFPLAGRFTNSTGSKKVMVDCNGEGAIFVEAEANCSIEIVGDWTKPNSSIHQQLVYLPSQDANQNDPAMPLITAQVTKFKCGGFAVGVCVHHFLLDGYGLMQFLNAWGETTRGEPLRVQPYLDRGILGARKPPKIEFPHHEFKNMEDISSNTITKVVNEEIIIKSFVFEHEKIKRLKMKVREDGCHVNYTSFETLTALVWRARTKALKFCPDQPIKLMVIVDGRSRLDHPVPEGYFGNVIVSAQSISTAREIIENPLSHTLSLVREAICTITDGYIRSAIDHFEETKTTVSSLNATVFITTWCRLSIHTIDFGWEKPITSGPFLSPSKYSRMFLPQGENQKGINVIISLPTSAMGIFQELIMQI